MAKIVRAVQWQVDHFTEIPVLVVACLRLGAREGRVPYVPMPHAGGVRLFRIDLPECAEPAARGARHGPWCEPDHLAAVERDFGAPNPQSATVGDSLLHRATRLAARALRAHNPQTGRAGDAPRCVRQPRLARHLMRLPSVTRPEQTWQTLRLDLSEAATAERKIALGERIAGESRTNRQAPTGPNGRRLALRGPFARWTVSVFSEFYIV